MVEHLTVNQKTRVRFPAPPQFGESSNGRTSVFDADNIGSSPISPAKPKGAEENSKSPEKKDG